MRLKEKTIVAVTLSTALGVTMFTGCGATKTAKKTAEQTKNKINTSVNNAKNKTGAMLNKTPKVTTKVKKTTIVFWHDWAGAKQAALNSAITDFEKHEPNITIKQMPIPAGNINDKIKAVLQSKSSVDVFTGPSDWLGVLGKTNKLEDIDKLSILKNNKKDMLPSALKAGMYKGKLLAFPESVEVPLLMYNKTLVKTPPKTVNEMIAMAKKLTKNGTYGLVMDKTDYYFQRAWYAAYGGKEFKSLSTAKPDFDNKKYVDFLTLMKKFEDAKIMPTAGDYTTITNLFTSGKAAFMINKSTAITDLDKAGMSGKYGLADYPKVDGKTSKPFMNVNEFYILKTSTNKSASAKFIKYMTSEKVAKMFLDKAGSVSASTKVKFGKNMSAMAIQHQAKTAEPVPNVPETAVIWTPLSNSIVKVLNGSVKPQKAAKDAQSEIEALIKKTVF